MTKVFLDGKPFIIQSDDTVYKIKERIAYATGQTLPKYISVDFDKVEDIPENSDLEYTNILEIDEIRSGNIDFEPFYKRAKKEWDLSDKDALKLWIFSRKFIDEDEKRMAALLLDTIIKELNLSDLLISLKRDEEILAASILAEIKEFRIKQKEISLISDKIEETKSLFSTKFEIDETTSIIEFDIHNLDILEIFNNFRIDLTTPFCSINNFYKFLDDFIPLPEWSTTHPEKLRIKVYNKKMDEDFEISDKLFSDIFIYTNERNLILEISTKKDMEIILSKLVEKTLESANQKKIKILNDNQCEYLNDKSKKIKTKQPILKEINGIFYIPQMSLNTYVFADLVMNNTIFSNFLNIQESAKAYRDRDSVTVYFNNKKTGNVLKAIITEKIMDYSDIDMRDQDEKKFPINSAYLRIKVSKASGNDEITYFRNIITKLFAIYKKEKNGIIEFYQKFLPKFGKEKVKDKKSETRRWLSDIEPDLFIKGEYGRACQNPPNIIEKSEKKKFEKDGFQVMSFPKNKNWKGKHGKSYSGRQHFYVCNKKEGLKFPGFIKNRIEKHKDKYPYVPCCYPKTQKLDKKYISYFSDSHLKENDEKLPEKQIHTFITQRLMKYEEKDWAKLPNNLSVFFFAIDPDYYDNYMRKGVDPLVNVNKQSPNSFIACLEIAMNEIDRYASIMTEKIFEKYLEAVRRNLITGKEEKFEWGKESIIIGKNSINLNVCKQEIFNLDLEQIKEYASVESNYFDPKMFVRLLEEYYNCNIFIFSRPEKSADCDLTIPNHLQTYYVSDRLSNNSLRSEIPTVLIYEHFGGEADKAKIYQCELIIFFDITKEVDNTVYNFDPSSNTSKQMNKTFSVVNNTYTLNKQISSYKLPQLPNVLSQYLDNYGKCRIIKIKYKQNKNFCVYVEPLPPFSAKYEEKATFKNSVRIKDALAFLKEFNVKSVSQVVENKKCVELHGKINNLEISLSITPTKKLDKIKVKNEKIINNSDVSLLEIYNKNKRLARYLLEYIFYLFSHFLHKKGKETVKLVDIKDFFDTSTILDKEFEYDLNISKKFSETSPWIKDKKLILNSEELRKRLVFSVRLLVMRNTEELLNYYKHSNIKNYFMDLSDFKINPKEVIIYDENVFLDWLENAIFDYTLYEGVIPSKDAPYFIENTILTNNKVNLAQNSDSLESAITIGEVWNDEKFNTGPGEESENAETLDFTLYSYKNKNDIKEYNEDLPIKVTGYLKEGEPEYTSILNL